MTTGDYRGNAVSANFGTQVVRAGERISGGFLRGLKTLPEGLLTVVEVATVLGVSKATVYTLVERGELAHVRLSNVIRFAPSDVTAFVRARRTEPT